MEFRDAWGFYKSEAPTNTFAGGTPYMMDDRDYPVDADGQKLVFLFQVDLAEVDFDMGLPENGFLQFFTGENDFYGANFNDFNNLDKNNRVLVRWIVAASDLAGVDRVSGSTPLANPSERVYFEGENVQIPLSPEDMNLEGVDNEYSEEYAEFSFPVFYLGGAPNYTQFEFRTQKDSNLQLLLGSVSNRDGVVMWGDSGSAQFWIEKSDLDKKDFSSAFLYWDCY